MGGGRVAAVVLAAGGATRMGSPKGVLRYRGRALVRIAAEAALDAGCRPVSVVLGAHAEPVGAEWEGLPLTVVTNRNWADGPGGSIRLGVRAIASTSRLLTTR